MSPVRYEHKFIPAQIIFFSHSTHGEKRKKHNIEVLVESTVFKQKAIPQVGNLMLSPPHCDFGRAPAFNQTNLLNILDDRDHRHRRQLRHRRSNYNCNHHSPPHHHHQQHKRMTTLMMCERPGRRDGLRQ